MRRILFFCEAVTLAHVARPVALAATLPAERFDTVIACPDRCRGFVGEGAGSVKSLHSISSERFLAALSAGRAVYDLHTLRGYVAQDLQLIDEVRPDVVVGDFRLSLSVSARLAKVPYIALSNAYWSPYQARRAFPLPVLPFTRFLPLAVAYALFQCFSPLVMRSHCAPMRRLRHENGLSSLPTDLRQVYTDADMTLYADFPAMYPDLALPPHHRFLGPVLWSPPIATPDWWDSLPADAPLVYVTMGSSGGSTLLNTVLDALADLPVIVVASSAGAPLPPQPPRNARIAAYLPGVQASARSSLVVCNGGSPTSQQALASGVPVLGIASNLDQFLNMEAVERVGAGLLLRADRADTASIRAACVQLLGEPRFRHAARALSQGRGAAVAQAVFLDAVKSLVH